MRGPQAISVACAAISYLICLGCDETEKECAIVTKTMQSGMLKMQWESAVGRRLKAPESAQAATQVAGNIEGEASTLANLQITNPRLKRYVEDYQSFAKDIKDEAARLAASYLRLSEAQAQSQAAEQAYQKSLEAFRQACPKKIGADCEALFKLGGAPEDQTSEGYEKKLLFYAQKLKSLELEDPSIKSLVDAYAKAVQEHVTKIDALNTAEGAVAASDKALAAAVEKVSPVVERTKQECGK